MKVLIYGGGAREHALAWKIKQSPLLSKLYLCKPNDGFAHLGEVMDAKNFSELSQKAKNQDIDLLVVGPENPLIAGIVDKFQKVGIPAIGADKKWAMLEGSKAFAKDFMTRNNIPTAGYININDKNLIKQSLDKFTMPVVLKADGLAAGKGVAIVHNREEAEKLLNDYLDGMFGEASKNVLIEEFLEGEELSLISIWDGKTLLPLIPARDHKRLLDNDEGPNTGGMGAFCPVKLTHQEQTELINYLKQLENALKQEQANFVGIIYSGLMMTKDGIKVLEYNMRFGDPETQPLMIHLESDLLEIFDKATKKELDKVKLSWKEGISLCVVVAADGYPFNPVKGAEISNVDAVRNKYNVEIFYAGVKKENNKLLANGGRVLSVCQTGLNPHYDVYKACEELSFKDKIYRKDIGGKYERACNNCGV